MNQVIKNDSTDCGNYDDAACIYSRIGDMEKSLSNLRVAFEKGFRRFHHVKVDDDLEELRRTDAFKMLIEEYEQAAENVNISGSSEVSEAK